MKFPALLAKMKAMKSNMLKQNDYDNLLAFDSLQEVTTYLKTKTHYQNILKDIDPETTHRRQLELSLRNAIISDILQSYFFVPNEAKPIIRHIEKRYEIENIKYVFGALHSDNISEITKEVFYPVSHKLVDEEILSNVKNFDDFFACIKGTVYEKVILGVYENYKKTKKLYIIANALDLWYFMQINKLIKSMPKYAENLKKLFYEQCDVINLQCMFRSKILFKLPVEEIKNLLIPLYFYIDKNITEKLLQCEEEESFVNVLSNTHYGNFFKDTDMELLPYIMDRIDENIVLNGAMRLLNSSSNGFDTLSGYMYLREYEYRNLITIIEKVRYKLESEKVKEFLFVIS